LPEREVPAAEAKRLVFEIDGNAPEHDTWGVGIKLDPVLRQAGQRLFPSAGQREVQSAEHSRELLGQGLTRYRQVLDEEMTLALRTRLQNLEQDLSKLPEQDMRWCRRYCKNMFFFAPALRAVAHAIGSAFMQQLQTEELFLMNDEISYNVNGEPHFDGWHLDINAWLSLPDDAWGWTIYVPLDEGSKDAGGGWLRFRDKRNPEREWDEEFKRGDVLIFDRWIWHRLRDFTRERPPRLAYLLRVTNDTRSKTLPLSPHYHEPLAKKMRFPVGWQINYYCTAGTAGAADPACRPRMGDDYDPHADEVRNYRFEVDADSAVRQTSQYMVANRGTSELERLVKSLSHMGRLALFDQMPDVRCDDEGRWTPPSSLVPSQGDGRGAQCDLWQRLRREGASASSVFREGDPVCRDVVVELPPVLPRCVRWLHCARQDDVVTTELVDHRSEGGFPDCLLLLPVLLWLAQTKGGAVDSLDDLLALDVGANVGSCSLLMLAAGLRVAAFEPVERNRLHLKTSAAKNPSRMRERLALLPYGLGSKSRSAFMVSQEGNAGNSHVVDRPGADISDFADSAVNTMVRSNVVVIRRLDDLLTLPADCGKGSVGAIALMKVDVQGFEFEVFTGAAGLLRGGAVGALMFECEADRLAQHSQVTALQLLQLVRNVGFVLLSQDGDLIDAGNEQIFAQRCDGHGLNFVALHSSIYLAPARLAIAACLKHFWLERGRHDFTSLASGGKCRELFTGVR